MRLYTATQEPLFFTTPSLADQFEKVGGISKVPDDAEKWPAHVRSEILRTHPYLARYDVSIVIDKKDEESGYVMGYAMVRNMTGRVIPAQEVGGQRNYVRIPIIVKDRQLEKFKTFELGGTIYPLTKARIESAMIDPRIFDSPADAPRRSKSLVNDIMPPYQQRQGFGRTYDAASAGLGTLGKGASASTGDELMREALDHLAMVKEAYGVPEGAQCSASASWEARWLRKFESTPLYKEAEALLVEDKEDALNRARRRAKSAAEEVAEAHLQVEGAELEARLARLKHASQKVAEALTLEKLSSCREEGSWADEFVGTPLHEAALLYNAKSADMRHRRETRWAANRTQSVREVTMAGLDAKLAAWTYQKTSGKHYPGYNAKVTVETGTHEKSAMIPLNFTSGDRIPGMTMASKVKKWNVAPGVVPSTYTFLRIRGTNYVMGVSAALSKKLLAEKDPAKLRKILAGPMLKEYRSMQAGRPSPGLVLLLTGSDKTGYSQIDHAASAGGA